MDRPFWGRSKNFGLEMRVDLGLSIVAVRGRPEREWSVYLEAHGTWQPLIPALVTLYV